ncbi:MAG: hypothetical protein IIB53_06105 [Planctomycetes bacterium]|nr:hypothetical protein [Planctomycetota bacterium]MCH8260035.1 hypothetical protein [Planctomycetota bacterium]
MIRPALYALTFIICAAANAQTDDSRNAATWYRRAYERFASTNVSHDEWEAIWDYQENPSAEPSATVRQVLARFGPSFSALRRGSRQSFSDFALDYEAGWDMRSPHLSPIREVAMMMWTDVRVRLYDGNSAAAADEIAALYRLGSHLPTDQTIGSSLVANSIFQGVDAIAQTGFDRGTFDPADAAKMLKALDGLAPKDPFDLLGAIRKENEITMKWLREQYADPNDRLHMIDDISTASMGPGDPALIGGMMLMGEGQFELALEQLEHVMDRTIEIFSLDDPEEIRFELQQLTQELKSGEHGTLTPLVLPAHPGLYERTAQAEQMLAERIAVLHAIATGVVTPQQWENAAVYYLRAIELLAKVEKDRKDELRSITARIDQPMSEQAAQALVASESIIATILEGSTKRRCEFAKDSYFPVAAIPDYLPGLREISSLMCADAVRLIQADKLDAAVGRLASMFRMAQHLSSDQIITTCLLSHAIFNEAASLVSAIMTRDGFTEPQIAQLVTAALTISRKDPFGYITAFASARKQHEESFRSFAKLDVEQTEQLRKLITGWDGDQLLYMLVITKPGAAVERSALTVPNPAIHPLRELLSLEGLTVALGEAEQIQRWIFAGNIDVFADRQIPEIGRVHEHLAAARADLGRTITVLSEKRQAEPAPGR